MKSIQIVSVLSLFGITLACKPGPRVNVDGWTVGEQLYCTPMILDPETYSPLNHERNFTKFHMNKPQTSTTEIYYNILKGPTVLQPSLDCKESSLCRFTIIWDAEVGWKVETQQTDDSKANKRSAKLTLWKLDLVDGKPAVIHNFNGPALRKVVYNPIGWCESSELTSNPGHACLDEWKPINIVSNVYNFKFPDVLFTHIDIEPNN